MIQVEIVWGVIFAAIADGYQDQGKISQGLPTKIVRHEPVAVDKWPWDRDCPSYLLLAKRRVVEILLAEDEEDENGNTISCHLLPENA